ncbi:unnamed protein product [Lampetra fluviatilis]
MAAVCAGNSRDGVLSLQPRHADLSHRLLQLQLGDQCRHSGQGWERLERQIERLTNAVSQLVLQLAGRQERLEVTVMATGEPAAGAVRSTVAETGENEASEAVVAAETPSPEKGSALRESGRLTLPAGATKWLTLRLDEAVLDSLVIEKMLALVQEMGVVLSIVEVETKTSLWIAWYLWAQEEMSRWTQVEVRVQESPDTIGCISCPGCRVRSAVGWCLLVVAAVEGKRGPCEEMVVMVHGWTGLGGGAPHQSPD